MIEKRIIDTEEGLKEYYERDAELADYTNLDEMNYQLERRRTEVIMHLLDLENATSLIDIGCGEGLQLLYFHNKFPHINLTGIDISEKRIERAKKKVPSANIRVTSATREGLGFDGKIFDRAICSEVLEHVPQPQKVLINTYKVLKSGGLFVVSVPYREKIRWFQCMNCGKLTTTGHINSFDEVKISSMLKDAGFTVISALGYKMVLLSYGKRLPYLWWKNLQKLFCWHYKKVKPYYLIALGRK